MGFEFNRRKPRGEYRHLVMVQVEGERVTNEHGDYVPSYLDLLQQYASIEGPPRENEAIAGNVERASVTHTVEMDYHPEIDHRSRIVLESGRILHVRGVVDLEERHVTLKLSCEEHA
jgi:head-tail adaptor